MHRARLSLDQTTDVIHEAVKLRHQAERSQLGIFSIYYQSEPEKPNPGSG
jgi:hypothetical protein